MDILYFKSLSDNEKTSKFLMFLISKIFPLKSKSFRILSVLLLYEIGIIVLWYKSPNIKAWNLVPTTIDEDAMIFKAFSISPV